MEKYPISANFGPKYEFSRYCPFKDDIPVIFLLDVSFTSAANYNIYNRLEHGCCFE